jgi:AcrR family transcriptional regulator
MALDEIPLRERKHSQTKLAILDALLLKLGEKTLDDISVKEICDTVPISEPTFYNYFGKKSDMLTYYLQLGVIEIEWLLANKLANKKPIESIEAVFEYFGRKIGEFPRLKNEFIIFLARESDYCGKTRVSDCEKLSVFKGYDGILEVDDNRCIEKILADLLKNAVREGQLPEKTDQNTALTSLLVILEGAAIAFNASQAKMIGPAYKKQLQILWSEIRATYGEGI